MMKMIIYNITLFHQLNGSIKICKKSTLINITQQKKKEKKKKKQDDDDE